MGNVMTYYQNPLNVVLLQVTKTLKSQYSNKLMHSDNSYLVNEKNYEQDKK